MPDSSGSAIILAGGVAAAAALLVMFRGGSVSGKAITFVSAGLAAGACVANARRRRRVEALNFVPWEQLEVRNAEKILVLDTTHPTMPCLTHHKMKYAPPAELRADTTTAMVLNAIRQRHSLLSGFTGVSVDHFDIDAFLSVFSACNPDAAMQFDAVLEEAAHIGDFRELDLCRKGAEDGLKVCCWINTLERQLYTRPFEGDDEIKWQYFLGDQRFLSFLRDLGTASDAQRHIWGAEYNRVIQDLEVLQSQGHVRNFDDISLCVVTVPRPLHYYALFSATCGYDVVLSSYPALSPSSSPSTSAPSPPPSPALQGEIVAPLCSLEIEQKYTQFINLESRETMPRIEMRELVTMLNMLESHARRLHERILRTRSQDEACSQRGLAPDGDGSRGGELLDSVVLVDSLSQDEGGRFERIGSVGCPEWKGERLVDSGPLHRLQDGFHLSKAQRYGHPYERPMVPSRLPHTLVERLLVSFLRHAFKGVHRRKRWTWSELHEWNDSIDWTSWKAQALADFESGDIVDVSRSSSMCSSDKEDDDEESGVDELSSSALLVSSTCSMDNA